MRRILVLLIIGVLVVGGLALARREQRAGNAGEAIGDTTEVIDQTTVERGDLRLTVSATGAVTPRRQVPLVFESSGIVREVRVTEGESVAEGDTLALLDTADLESSLSDAEVRLSIQQIANDALTSPARPEDLSAAEAAVNAAQASVNAAYSSGDSNQAEIARLRGELARNQLWQAQLQGGIAASAQGFTPDVSGLIPDGVDVSQETIDQINQGLAGVIPSFPSVGGVSQESLQQAEYGVEIADANAAAAASRG
ncbi:MAG: biotin/lipoyl-binding protein, partial [Chloroflexota bacterium]